MSGLDWDALEHVDVRILGDHITWLELAPADGLWYPVCSCGWDGDARLLRSVASTARLEHLLEEDAR